MLLLGAIILFLLLMGSITLYGYRSYAKPGRLYERLASTPSSELSSVEDSEAEATPVLTRIAMTIGELGEKTPFSPQDVSMTKRYLIAAGYRSEHAVQILYGLKFLSSLVLFSCAVLARNYLAPSMSMRLAILAGAVVVGFLAPNFILERQIKRRQERLRLSLPDALDLMVVCVEAGLGLDQAILNVSRELKMTHKDISDELGLVTLEMRAGTRRSDALRSLSDRTGEQEIRRWTATLIQADRFGTSVADSLRTHSEFLRIKRRQKAEERAAKIGVKLVFPIFFFIMPAMMIVAAGPGLLQLFKQLIPMMEAS